MNTLQQQYDEVKNSLQYGPGLAPFFEQLISEIESIKQRLTAFDGEIVYRDPILLLGNNLSGANQNIPSDPIETEDAKAREDIGILIDQVAELTETVKQLVVKVATPPDSPQTAEQVAAPSGITAGSSVPPSPPSPEPSGAAPDKGE